MLRGQNMTSEKIERYRSLVSKLTEIQKQESALLEEMDALWYSMNGLEVAEFSVRASGEPKS